MVVLEVQVVTAVAEPESFDIGELATSTEFEEDFEGGGIPAGWTATGLWNVTSSCSPPGRSW